MNNDPIADADEDPHGAERPSKTQRKREMTALQTLGARLVALNADQLGRLDLPERLHEAVREAQRISAHEGRRRQLQFIGKLMRQVDPEPIERGLDELGGDSRAQVALMHRCERWRDRLLDDDGALTELLAELLAEHPGIDAQALRAMVRAARRERAANGTPRHARELYRWLHDHFAAGSH